MVALVVMGLWPGFCGVIVVTYSYGGECMVGLTANYALLSWLMLMLCYVKESVCGHDR